MTTRLPREQEIEALFRLRPLKGARVSEISEAAAASDAAPEDRVNFHIGNPVQDPRLAHAYVRIALGLGLPESGERASLETLTADAGGTPEQASVSAFLQRLIEKSAPYTPRGGFARTAPNEVALAFENWFTRQQEPLAYDMGQTSGKREVLLASGGVQESLRILFHALAATLVHRPAHICLVSIPLALDATEFPGLLLEHLGEDDSVLLTQLEEKLRRSPEAPFYLILGRILREESRRALRQICLHNPLFIVEANDAPNHCSLAREAKLNRRVLRFLTPGVFTPQLAAIALACVVGPADVLAAFDAFHFQLKGTPSASEVELLAFLLARPRAEIAPELPPDPFWPPAVEGISLATRPAVGLEQHAQHATGTIGRIASSAGAVAQAAANRLERSAERLAHVRVSSRIGPIDMFGQTSALDLLEQLAANVHHVEWRNELRRSLIGVFTLHHPEYDRTRCVAVSGSSRTALGLLGYHCGIDEVIIPDLSWSYEHCFPAVRAVPLTAEFGLDADAIIDAVRARLEADPDWHRHGAVALNNPHNATGRIFEEKIIRGLLMWLLHRGVYVIDDLSYQEVAPAMDLPGIATIRQLANRLVSEGALTESEADRVITVHSVSKTDCLAGARLAVMEIREEDLFRRFKRFEERIVPNCGALALTYLFYRNDRETANAYGRLRNRILLERSQALLDAAAQLPGERNPYNIGILPPTGSMYPLLVIRDLPPGLSLDWLASGLARQGIGMLPLATFARTQEGYETGRRAFRLTLGGTDSADVLLKKTRLVLIDLNRLIAQESARYLRKLLQMPELSARGDHAAAEREDRWKAVAEAVGSTCARLDRPERIEEFLHEYLPQRLVVFRQRFVDRSAIAEEMIRKAREENGRSLTKRLEHEFFKDDLQRREREFAIRPYDRTVHPTQMYSIACERAFDRIIEDLIAGTDPGPRRIRDVARELLREYHGLNIAITSSEESAELLLDLEAITYSEHRVELTGRSVAPSLISFWGDWDGSNRPSGQGHRLVAFTLIANVDRLARILALLHGADPRLPIGHAILDDMVRLPKRTERFTRLLNEITVLTHHLEKRYRGVLPINIRPGTIRRLGMRLHIARDPLARLWRHNDRLERRMVDLRVRRRTMLEQYFALNKRLRKQLAALIPTIPAHLNRRDLLLAVSLYRDPLQRVVITPRIHENMITAQDPFAIDTTVHNIQEINAIAGASGTPGIILALQVSMSTKAEALISLDRKLRGAREQTLREHPGLDLPQVRLIPLFEDLNAVRSIPEYLGKIWDYALASRRVNEDPSHRFAEIIAEVFIAGSDLSQQISQTAGAALYRQAKQEIVTWLAERHLVDRVRLKLGSGEPMQRQGGSYAPMSGRPAFERTPDELYRAGVPLPDSACRSTVYATTPLMGLFTGGDLRTLQSAVSEQLRLLPVDEMVQVLHHLREDQRQHRNDLIRAAETLVDTRLIRPARGTKELERLTIGSRDPVFERFVSLLTEDFRQILYGREEDVVGIHLVSYFIARTMPQLRDRPTVRPSVRSETDRGQRILGDIARMIPMASHGTLLRAIAHNQAQTAVLGVNQLTTGLFRALGRFAQVEFTEGEPEALIADRILPRLPVYEILHTLRIYHDPDLTHVRRVEAAFPAGNSAFLALREDHDALRAAIPFLQQELIRRHGLAVADFFDGVTFVPDLLPAVRPDLAVLLQTDLFNTRRSSMLGENHQATTDAWERDVDHLLTVPERIRSWRSKIWDLLEEPITQRIRAFAELAVALNSLSATHPLKQGGGHGSVVRVPTGVAQFFRSAKGGDEMRRFLGAAFDYLSAISEGMAEVPVTIVRSMWELERIIRIEEQAIPPEQQEDLRFYTLQIARLAGENG